MAPVNLRQEATSPMVGMVLISSDEHMDKTCSPAACSGGTYSTLLVLAATTTPNGATLATGEPVSTLCVANAPGKNLRPPSAEQPTPSGAFLNLHSPNLDWAPSTCGEASPSATMPTVMTTTPGTGNTGGTLGEPYESVLHVLLVMTYPQSSEAPFAGAS